ncbi:hypothetical protein [Symbiobacterium terraclitae]|uniref:hypothetical protein n=1 Tax=Symbiobacterium terraclitae TaxID=557451 RepID=UPI0035B503EB
MDMVFEPEIPRIDTIVADFVDALCDAGFAVDDEPDLGPAQREISAFARDPGHRFTKGLGLAHPQLGGRVGLLMQPARDAGAGPDNAVLFTLSLDELTVMDSSQPYLTASAEHVIVPLCTRVAVSLPTVLIDLQHFGCDYSAWEAWASGREPRSSLLYLAPGVAGFNPGRWRRTVRLENGGVLYLVPGWWNG